MRTAFNVLSALPIVLSLSLTIFIFVPKPTSPEVHAFANLGRTAKSQRCSAHKILRQYVLLALVRTAFNGVQHRRSLADSRPDMGAGYKNSRLDWSCAQSVAPWNAKVNRTSAKHNAINARKFKGFLDIMAIDERKSFTVLSALPIVLSLSLTIFVFRNRSRTGFRNVNSGNGALCVRSAVGCNNSNAR